MAALFTLAHLGQDNGVGRAVRHREPASVASDHRNPGERPLHRGERHLPRARGRLDRHDRVHSGRLAVEQAAPPAARDRPRNAKARTSPPD